MNTAVIDIGTNTLLLLIVDEVGKPVVDLARFGRLGKGLDASGALAADAIANSLEICREYRRVMDEHAVSAPTVIATQAMREAKNAREFVEPAESILGATIEVIAGTREADLAFTAVARTFPELAGTPYVVVDVGGGSTELIVTDGTRVVSAVSVPIGAVRLTERHLQHDPPIADEVKSLIANIDSELDKLALPTGVPIIATAGTATTMAAIQLGLETYDPDAVTGFRMEQGAVDALFGVLAMTTVNARKLIPGLEHQRADVIAGGVAIYSRAMGRIAAPVLITCDRGIRWGVAYEQLAKN